MPILETALIARKLRPVFPSHEGDPISAAQGIHEAGFLCLPACAFIPRDRVEVLKDGLRIKDRSGSAYHAHDESLVILLPSGPRRTVRTDDRGPEGNGASGNIPKPRSDRPALVMTDPDWEPNPSAYGAGCVTVLASNVTAVCANSLPFTVAPVAKVIPV